MGENAEDADSVVNLRCSGIRCCSPDVGVCRAEEVEDEVVVVGIEILPKPASSSRDELKDKFSI
jgi:hypothetical protein